MSLRLINITKSFGEKKILNCFSYDFPQKGVVALVGDSGIGKTTLLRIIANLDEDYDGNVLDGGIKNVSIAFQEYRLLTSITALENVVLANSDTKSEAEIQRAKDMLLKAGLSEDEIDLYPNELSGGMKQRVSLCRAFLREKPILLLDEPTKELDSNNVNRILDIVREIAEQRLVIVVTHSESDIEYLNATKIQITKI